MTESDFDAVVGGGAFGLNPFAASMPVVETFGSCLVGTQSRTCAMDQCIDRIRCPRGSAIFVINYPLWKTAVLRSSGRIPVLWSSLMSEG